MRLKVWLRTYWTDTRLAWNPADYGGITTVPFTAQSFSAPEDSEIWLPDVTPYNSLTGLMSTFDPEMATVSSNGEVFWSRPGLLDVMCRFSGLVNFPTDSLSCNVEIGGWALGGGVQGVYPHSGGFTFSKEDAAQPTYTELQFDQVSAAPPTPPLWRTRERTRSPTR